MNFTFKYRKYAKALYHALRDDAFYCTMEGSVNNGSPKEAMLKYMEFSMVEGQAYGELYIPEDHDCGVSIWLKPLGENQEKEKHDQKEAFLLEHMGKESLETYTSIVNFMSAKSSTLIDKKSWYLSIIGIFPGFQGQGLGGGLIEAVLDKADQSGVPTYLETFTPRNITFYNRIGYEVVERFHEPTTDADYWIMIRDVNN